MFTYSCDEALAVFKGAKNINSALKKVLKNEVQKGDPLEQFVKSLRNVAASKREEALSEFLEKNLSEHERELLVIISYAYSGPMEQLSDKIMQEYAEDFNASYQRDANGITIQDHAKFEGIATQVLSGLNTRLDKCGLPSNGFMKNVLVHIIFEQDVLEEIKPIIKNLVQQ